MIHSRRVWLALLAIQAAVAAVAISSPARPALAASIGDVFVITMENHNFTQPASYTSTQAIFGNANAPYLNSLITVGNPNAAQTSWASNYTSLGSSIHPSEPNYVWTEAGTSFGITTDNNPYGSGGNAQTSTQHLTGLLQQGGISWKSYQEDIDLNTSTGAPLAQSAWTVPLNDISGTFSSGTNPYNGSNQFNYSPKHNPAVFFSDTNGGNNTTTSNTQRLSYAPLQQLQTDLTNNTVSKFNWITPDLFNDMHTGLTGGFTYHGNHLTGDSAQIAQGDNFLATVVPEIMSSTAYQNNGLILIWFDETEGGDTSNFTIPYIAISPLAKGNAYQSTVNYSHTTDLRTLQEIFQVTGTAGYLGAANNVVDESDMFQSGTLTPLSATWSGLGGNSKWSTAGNWSFAPSNGVNLIFTGSTNTTTSNDSLTSVGSITFDNTAIAFSLSGNALTISGGITNSSNATQVVNMNLKLSAAQQFTAGNASGYNLIVNGNIDNGGNLLTLSTPTAMKLTGAISGAGGLVVNHTHQGGLGVVLSGNNTYSGGTTIIDVLTTSNSTVAVGHDNVFGTGGLTVNNATVDLGGFNVTVAALNGNGLIQSVTGAGTGTLTVGSGDAGGSFSGTLGNSSTMALVKIGAGTQILSGFNAIVGGTTVNGGTLQLGSNNALLATPGIVTVNSGGTLDLHGFSPSIGALSGNGGNVTTNVAGAVTMNISNAYADATYAGTIADGSGTLAITKSGGNKETLAGNNTYSLGTTVTGGTLVVAHPHALGSGPLAINNNAKTQIASGVGTVVVSSLSVNAGAANPTATFDVGKNSVVIPYSGTSPFATIRSQIMHAADGDAWDRAGITDSSADGATTGLGYAEATDVEGDVSSGGTYINKQSPSQSGANTVISNQAVILKLTYLGDADLTGTVDGFDYNILTSNLGTSSGATWAMGDTNYDGTVDGFDYNNFTANLGSTGLSDDGRGAAPVPVPEPSTWVLALLGLFGIGIGAMTKRT